MFLPLNNKTQCIAKIAHGKGGMGFVKKHKIKERILPNNQKKSNVSDNQFCTSTHTYAFPKPKTIEPGWTVRDFHWYPREYRPFTNPRSTIPGLHHKPVVHRRGWRPPEWGAFDAPVPLAEEVNVTEGRGTRLGILNSNRK